MATIPPNASEEYALTANNRIDFAYIETPKVFEEVDFAKILADAIEKVETGERDAGREPGQIYESHTFAKLLEAVAYLKELLMHRVNEAARAVLLPYAEKTDLEALGAFYGVTRQLMRPLAETQGVPVWEEDDHLRMRIALAPEGLSVAGTLASYKFKALSANDRAERIDVVKDGADVLVRYHYGYSFAFAQLKDVTAVQTEPGHVTITLLNYGEDLSKIPGQLTVDAMQARFLDPGVKALTDVVLVQAAKPVSYKIEAKLAVYPGVDRAKVLSDAKARLAKFLVRQNYLGRDITRDAIVRELMSDNSHHVDLIHPAADVIITPFEVAQATGVNVTLEAQPYV